MHDIQKICVFIYFMIVMYNTMCGANCMVKALGCDLKSEGSNPILNILRLCQDSDDMS
jgi:hypothetical protein